MIKAVTHMLWLCWLVERGATVEAQWIPGFVFLQVPLYSVLLKAPGIRSVRKRTSVFCSKRELSRKWLIWPKRRKHHRFQTLTHPKMQLTSSLVMHKAQLRCTAGQQS